LHSMLSIMARLSESIIISDSHSDVWLLNIAIISERRITSYKSYKLYMYGVFIRSSKIELIRNNNCLKRLGICIMTLVD
jgi:hypothetical protein